MSSLFLKSTKTVRPSSAISNLSLMETDIGSLNKPRDSTLLNEVFEDYGEFKTRPMAALSKNG